LKKIPYVLLLKTITRLLTMAAIPQLQLREAVLMKQILAFGSRTTVMPVVARKECSCK